MAVMDGWSCVVGGVSSMWRGFGRREGTPVKSERASYRRVQRGAESRDVRVGEEREGRQAEEGGTRRGSSKRDPPTHPL